jgi:hypothetical protein
MIRPSTREKAVHCNELVANTVMLRTVAHQTRRKAIRCAPKISNGSASDQAVAFARILRLYQDLISPGRGVILMIARLLS